MRPLLGLEANTCKEPLACFLASLDYLGFLLLGLHKIKYELFGSLACPLLYADEGLNANTSRVRPVGRGVFAGQGPSVNRPLMPFGVEPLFRSRNLAAGWLKNLRYKNRWRALREGRTGK